MKHYYSTVNNIALSHSDMLSGQLGRQVCVRFERPNANGFDFAEGVLPECVLQKSCGFTENELFELQDYLRCNAMLIWDYAQKGGGVYA